jgi:hypothetical protein
MAIITDLKRQLSLFLKGDDEEEVSPPMLPPNYSNSNKNSSYSHGFESIYSMETIDVRTVRRMGGGDIPETISPSTSSAPSDIRSSGESTEFKTKSTIRPPSPTSPFARVSSDNQSTKSKSTKPLEFHSFWPELPLGGEYQGCIESFKLDEPIQVLALSERAETALRENDFFHLRHLIDLLRSGGHVKGLGQGHLDEVRTRLTEYFDGEEIFHSTRIDFIGLLRSTLAGGNRKRTRVLLEEIGLQEIIHLTKAEAVEVKHLSDDKKREMRIAALEDLVGDKAIKQLRKKLQLVATVFITPWMRGRDGIASEFEILERVKMLSVDPENTEKVLGFLQKHFLEGRFPFYTAYPSVAKGVYAVDKMIQKNYQQIEQKCRSYFYRPDVSYHLDHLLTMVQREFTKKWIGYPDSFYVKVLSSSSFLRIRRGMDRKLTVYTRS